MDGGRKATESAAVLHRECMNAFQHVSGTKNSTILQSSSPNSRIPSYTTEWNGVAGRGPTFLIVLHGSLQALVLRVRVAVLRFALPLDHLRKRTVLWNM